MNKNLHFRQFQTGLALGALGLGLLAGGVAQAQTRLHPMEPVGRQFIQVQSDAAFRINELEEQVRQLNGKIEELNFLILQMQEQIRKQQEDNEFRFQELEQKNGKVEGQGGAVVAGEDSPGKSLPSESQAQDSGGDTIARVIEREGAEKGAGQPRNTIEGVEIGEIDGNSGQAGDSELQPGALGNLVFDANGNVVNSTVEKPVDLTGRNSGQASGGDIGSQGGGDQQENAGNQTGSDTEETEIASLPQDAGQLYDIGYNYLQSGDYDRARATFSDFTQRFPDDPRFSEARFWIGESLLSQKNYEEAAKVFLDVHKQFPKSRIAPQNLLKLGVSLMGLDQRELACATFAEVGRKYPEASGAVRASVAAEQKSASCKAG